MHAYAFLCCADTNSEKVLASVAVVIGSILLATLLTFVQGMYQARHSLFCASHTFDNLNDACPDAKLRCVTHCFASSDPK